MFVFKSIPVFPLDEWIRLPRLLDLEALEEGMRGRESDSLEHGRLPFDLERGHTIVAISVHVGGQVRGFRRLAHMAQVVLVARALGGQVSG